MIRARSLKLSFFLFCVLSLSQGNSPAQEYSPSSLEMTPCVSRILKDRGRDDFPMEKMDAFALMDIRTGRILWIENPKVLSSFVFQAGSTFKLVTAYAALDSGKVDIHDIFYCRGNPKPAKILDGRKKGSGVKCWLESGHGPVDLMRALAYSCNLYFARLAHAVPARELVKAARLFGLGQSTCSDIPGEVSGSLPQHVDLDDVERFAIGQGRGVAVTGLGLLSMVAAIANDGVLLRPTVKPVSENKISERGFVGNSQALEFIRHAMVQASQFGTGSQQSLYELGLAGKTGTAQWKDVPWRTHGWYVGYWPMQRPAFAVVAFVFSGTGSHEAAGLAKEAVGRFMAAEISCFFNVDFGWKDR